MTTLVGYVMLGVAVWTIWKKWDLTRQVEDSLTWPSTDGEIISSGISSESSRTMNSPNRTFRANIRYSYQVGGRKLTNDRICVGGQLQISMRGKAEEYCRRYPKGRSVRVHYDPRKATESVLETREETAWFYLILGAGFALIGCAFITGFIG